MIPVVFDKTIGWIHPARGRRGLVIAGAHGFEDLCSRRFLTLLARRAAGAGHPVIQFDYPGCGDAAGDHAEPGRVAAWVAGIGAAIDRLKRETGVEEVVVVGFRLGALLAPLAVAGRGDVSGLALLAPPASGKSYVREITGLSRMIDAALPGASSRPTAGDDLVSAGFRVSGETRDALRALDWTTSIAVAGVADVLLMPTVATASVAATAEKLGARGATVRTEPFENYNLLMCDPTANVAPMAVVDIVAGWLGAAQKAGELAPIAVGGHEMLKGPDFEEWPVTIGASPQMCGVLCRPLSGDSEDVVLMINSGGVPHVGWARGTVEEARALAAAGVSSLRIDLPGLGQSEAHAEERRFLYDSRTTQDVVRIVDWLERAGFAGVCAVGTCSGAFQAFHAARIEPRINRLVMINPLCFAWNPSYALDMTVWKTYEASKASRAQTRGGDEPPAHVDEEPASNWSMYGRRSARRGLEIIKSAFSRVAPTGLFVRRPVERWMSDLGRRGVRVLMVTSRGDLSIREIDRHFGADGARLASVEGLSRVWLDDADHTLTPLHAKQKLAEEVAGLMRKPLGEAGRKAVAVQKVAEQKQALVTS